MAHIISVENFGKVETEIETRNNKIVGIRRSGSSIASDRICKIARFRIPNEADFIKIEEDFPCVNIFCFEVEKREQTPMFGGAICS